MTRIRRGDVYLAQFAAFPHEKEVLGKERPVVIVQNDEDNENQTYPLIMVVPVSTQKVDRIYKQDVLLPKGIDGLSDNSKALVGIVRTIPKTDLVRRLGHLPPAKLEEINLKLLRQMGFLER
jgi:mRNA interferase MazF